MGSCDSIGEQKAKLMPVELHAASAFSFLRASSLPEDLVERAAELGLDALALVDRDGLAGAPRFFKAAKARGIRPIVGAELSLEGGGALPLLVETQRGYKNLCRLITRMKDGVPKGEGRLRLEMLRGLEAGLYALPGVETLQPSGAGPLDTDRLARLVESFGPGRVWLDVQRHRRRDQEAANQELVALADALGLAAVATNGVRHATSQRRRAPGRAHLHPREAHARERRAPAGPERRAPPQVPEGDGRALRRPQGPAAERRGARRAARVHARGPGLPLPGLPGAVRGVAAVLPAPGHGGGRARPLPPVPREGAPAGRARARSSSASSSSPATS